MLHRLWKCFGFLLYLAQTCMRRLSINWKVVAHSTSESTWIIYAGKSVQIHAQAHTHLNAQVSIKNVEDRQIVTPFTVLLNYLVISNVKRKK